MSDEWSGIRESDCRRRLRQGQEKESSGMRNGGRWERSDEGEEKNVRRNDAATSDKENPS